MSNETLRTLPGDDVRQVMWRFSDRYDLQMLVQSVRGVARGPVARAVADGARHSHEWTDAKNQLLGIYDQAGITTLYLDPEHGGYIAGPKNVALALLALELAWVDAGAATCAMANYLGLEPIYERGNEKQKAEFLPLLVPPKPGENRAPSRYAFALTEPIPYVGVETGMLCGKVRVAEWKEGQEPVLQVEKRCRFITNADYANIIVAAVDTDDERIKTSCMVIVREEDPGTLDRGAATRKMVHQLSSTRDPVINKRVPASRIVGGYSIEDGKIVPRFNHGEVIDAVFRRTRVTVGVMTAAKLLSAVEPIIRYHRTRFRGGAGVEQGTPRFELGIQQKEDALHRLADIWAFGEAATSLGFAASRVFDELAPLESAKIKILEQEGIKGGRAELRALRKHQKDAVELAKLSALPEGGRDAKRFEALKANTLVQYLVADSLANVLCPATKLWNTGQGTNVMREAVALVGGYGITEDCPGFLGHKWMDGQLEATYEGPETVQRRQLSMTMADDIFLAQYQIWVDEARNLAKSKPESGAGTLAAAMDMWLWTLNHLKEATDANGAKLFQGSRHGVTYSMADALCWILGAHCFMQDVQELERKGPETGAAADGLPGLLSFYWDLVHVQIGRAAGEVGRICAELACGYAAAAPDEFAGVRAKLDKSLAGCRLAKDRVAQALTKVMIPEVLDYPQ